ncbi:MAG: four helix bundle protein [Patescibacteria group bacterium]
MTNTFKDLIVWQKSKQLAVEIYKLTEKFPKSELYGLVSQMRRAAISISSNIAEGYKRFHSKEKKQLFSVASGSGTELESQIEITKELFPEIDFSKSILLLEEIMKILNNFVKKLS